MKDVRGFVARAGISLLTLFVAVAVSPAKAEIQSGQVIIQAVTGTVTCAGEDGVWKAVTANTVLTRGMTIKTDGNATADLLFGYNGTVLRMTPSTALELAKLNRQAAGEDIVTETSLNLLAGSIVGSQRKLAAPSRFDVNLPGGVVTIRGTEYLVRADGAVTTLSGSVQVTYNLPQNGGSVKVTVPAGFSFNPATGQVVPTTPDYLVNIIADVDTVRNNARVFKAGGATVVVKPDGTISPSRPKGNNGVGNGVDPQPPGNPPVNDGPGTGPGNPGNKGKGHNNVVPRNRPK